MYAWFCMLLNIQVRTTRFERLLDKLGKKLHLYFMFLVDSKQPKFTSMPIFFVNLSIRPSDSDSKLWTMVHGSTARPVHFVDELMKYHDSNTVIKGL